MMTSLPNDLYQPKTPNNSTPSEILIMTADGVEDLEFFYPYYRFIEAGFSVDVVTPEGKGLKGKQGLGLKETMKISEVDASDYKLLYLPGGRAPDALKKRDDAIALTRQFYSLNKPISAVCHGPQILAAAKIIKGRKIAAWPEVESEVREAGGIFVNKETVIDGPFVTARWPGDLPTHLKATLAILGNLGEMSKTGHVAS